MQQLVRGVIIGSVLCCLNSAVGYFTPARATTVTSNDIVTMSLPSSGNFLLDSVNIFLNLSTTDPLGPNEGFRARLFDGSDTLRSIRNPSSGQFVFDTSFGIPFNLSGTVFGSGGHVIIDNVVGSFELEGANVTYVALGGSTIALGVPVSFEVNAVPLPAALPLFATGLGALGLLGWRRKKKAAALAA